MSRHKQRLDYYEDNVFNTAEIPLKTERQPAKRARTLLDSDKEAVLAAVGENGHALQFASQDLRGNLVVVAKAVFNEPSSLQFASDELKDNENLVRLVPDSLEHASERLRRHQLVDPEKLTEAIDVLEQQCTNNGIKCTGGPFRVVVRFQKPYNPLPLSANKYIDTDKPYTVVSVSLLRKKNLLISMNVIPNFDGIIKLFFWETATHVLTAVKEALRAQDEKATLGGRGLAFVRLVCTYFNCASCTGVKWNTEQSLRDHDYSSFSDQWTGMYDLDSAELKRVAENINEFIDGKEPIARKELLLKYINSMITPTVILTEDETRKAEAIITTFDSIDTTEYKKKFWYYIVKHIGAPRIYPDNTEQVLSMLQLKNMLIATLKDGYYGRYLTGENYRSFMM